MRKVLWRAARMLIAMTILTGVLYPLIVTIVSQAVFPQKANGSLVTVDDRTVGSLLIGQEFRSPRYFWGRPSATAQFPYNAGASGGSNLALSNPEFVNAVKQREAEMMASNPGKGPVPADLVTASASGLDPHITVKAAMYQVERVGSVRKLDPDVVRRLVEAATEHRTLGLFGEPRVNVLRLNLALDALRQ